MVYFRKPKDFNPQFEAVSCYLRNSGKILLLKRQLHKSQGGKWGPPAGKIEKNETPLQAIQREILEETGIKVLQDKLTKIAKIYVSEPEVDFIWNMFWVSMKTKEVILRKEEHEEFAWVTPLESLKYELVLDEDQCIKKVFNLL